jgi:iron complex outermembrane receptor protein
VCNQKSAERDNPNYCRPRDANGRNINFNDLSNEQKLSDRSDGNQDQEYDLNAITGEVTYRLSPKYSFVSLTGWRAFEDTAWTDVDATPVNSVNLYRHGPYKQITEELRFHAQPLDVLNFVAGVYGWYSHYRTLSEGHNLLDNAVYDSIPLLTFDDPETPWDETVDGPNPPGSYTVADTQQTSYSGAVFAQGDWEFLPNTTLTLGGRLTHDIKDLSAVSYTERPGVYMDTPYPPLVVTFPLDAGGLPFAASDPGDHALVDKHSWTRVTGKASLSYAFAEDLIGKNNALLLYGGYASGFRSGGFNGRPTTAKVAKPYHPETVDQFELGVKSSWWRGRLVANVAGYYTLYHDKQEAYQVSTMETQMRNASAYGNAGEASIKGVEVELSSMPLKGIVDVVDRFRLWAIGAITDAQYDEFKVALSGTDKFDYAKGPYKIEMRLAPLVQVAAGFELPIEVADGRCRVVPGASYRYRTRQRAELTTEPNGLPNDMGISDPAGYLDTSLTAEWGNFLAMQWRLTAYVRNVMDYVEFLGATNVGVATRAVYGRPRTWGLELQARYN